MSDPARDQAIAAYRKKFLEHRELESRVKKTRFELRSLVQQFDKTEEDLKAIQNMGQIIGEVLKQLDEDRFIVKASSGPRYVVGCRTKVNQASKKNAMVAGTRVALDMTTLTIMRTLPREVDPVVFNMINESPGKISYSDIGGLNDQIRELREVIELPLTNPELFKRVGIKPPKGVLLYGPPGTGKTLLARALANNIKASYLKVVASAIVDKYIGECFAPGTQIMMADATKKAVEHIQPGDRLVGDDGTIRVVQPGSLVHDYGEMFKVVSADKAKNAWFCTKNHVLVLKISEPPCVATHRGKYVIRQWELEQTRSGPLTTHRPVRCSMNSGSKSSTGADVPLRFADKADADAYLTSIIDCWRPVIFECTIGDYMSWNEHQKQVCALYAPEDGVNFAQPSQSLRSTLESAFGSAITDEQLASSAWAIAVWLVDGCKGSSLVSQIGVNHKRPANSHVAVIQGLVRWHLSMYGPVEASNDNIDDALLVGLNPAERSTARAIVRSTHITSSGNRAYSIDLGANMLTVLRSYGIDMARRMSADLLSESKSVRRSLLAGLVDGAGQLNKAQQCEILSQNVELLENVVHLARGLGLRASTIDPARVVDDDKDSTYSGARLIIRGQLPEIKQSHLKQSINQSVNHILLCDSFTVEPVGVQEYFGFQVDGNRRFVLADCTVTHNSARIIREMFGYAKDHQPCVIFMDEVDAIGGRRFSQGTSADREIQRTLMELLNQLDGFDDLGQVKMVMATNRPDTLDPALLRPGRLDRKIEIPIPTEANRLEILKIHAASIAKHGDIDYEAVVKLCEGFNGADLRNVCTEAGMFAIRVERGYTIEEDFIKAARKIAETKKLEGKLDYEKV